MEALYNRNFRWKMLCIEPILVWYYWLKMGSKLYPQDCNSMHMHIPSCFGSTTATKTKRSRHSFQQRWSRRIWYELYNTLCNREVSALTIERIQIKEQHPESIEMNSVIKLKQVKMAFLAQCNVHVSSFEGKIKKIINNILQTKIP